MKAIKRIIALILVSIFVIGAIFISYTGIKNGAVVYATVNDDSIYVPLRSQSDAVKAFQAYCKSRDLTIEGSLTDAVTTFTTGAFNSACNEIGIDITELQAEIKAEYDNSGEPVKFFFNDTGVMAMNRIFAQFLQDNELDVGDEDVNKTVYSGRYFVDDNNNGCLCYIYQGTAVSPSNSDILAKGSTYLYDWTNVRNIGTYPYRYDFTYKGHSYFWYITYSSRNGGSYSAVANNTSGGNVLYAATSSSNPTNRYKGQCTVAFNSTTEKLYMAVHYDMLDNNTVNTLIIKTQLTDQDTSPISIVIVSNQINNNIYEGDTYITNEGDIINNPDNPDFPDYPEEPTGNVDDWGADMPDLNIPWYLQGKEEKFPWNIPFNIMLTLSILKAEPQAPHFEGTMDFKFTTYDYDIDLSQFDDVAEVLRKMEVIAFLIGLMVLTKNLIGW